MLGVTSVGVMAAACAPGSVASGVGCDRDRGRDGRHGHSPGDRIGCRGRQLPALVRRRPRADRGPVLRQREPRALRHPDRHRGRLGLGRCRAEDRLGRLAGRRQRVHPARGRARRRLALRRARQLLGRRERAGPRLPARLPAHGCQRRRHDHDHLPGLVPGARGPHPLQDPDGPGGIQRLRVHLAALLRRRAQRPGLRPGRLRVQGGARRQERQRRHLPAEPGHDAPGRRRTATATRPRSRSPSRRPSGGAPDRVSPGACPPASSRPERRTRDDRADDRADRQAAQERGGRPRLPAAHVTRVAGPRMATADETAIPIQATIDAASRWKSPIIRTSNPRRSASASPAHAPRMAATTMIGSRRRRCRG